MRLDKFTTVEGLAAAIRTLLSKNFVSKTRLTADGFLSLGTPTILTISGGVVTATGSYHRIETESSATADDLDTINGGSDGDLLVLQSYNSDHVVTYKDNTGNLRLEGDFIADNNKDKVFLLYDGTYNTWDEITRSNNA